MTLSDIPNKYFLYLIQYSKSIAYLSKDLKQLHNIDISQESKSFPSQLELSNMRKNKTELTLTQWDNYWNIIKNKAIAEIDSFKSLAEYNKECEELNKNHPIQYDELGYPYRNYPDYNMGGM